MGEGAGRLAERAGRRLHEIAGIAVIADIARDRETEKTLPLISADDTDRNGAIRPTPGLNPPSPYFSGLTGEGLLTLNL